MRLFPLATAAAIDPASSRVAVGDSSGVVQLYDAATGQSNGMQPLRGHSDTVTAIVFGRDKNDLMSASSNGTVAVWDLAGRQGPAEELPQLNPSPSIMRLSSTGGLLAASNDEGRAGVWRLAEGRWELLRDLIVATLEADADGETLLRKEKAKGPDGFVEIGMLEIPSIAMDDAGTRIVWSTNGGAILTVVLNQPSQRTMVVVPPGHMPPEDLVVSGNGRVIAAIEAGGSRISVAELDASGGVLLSLIVPPARFRRRDQIGGVGEVCSRRRMAG